MRSASVVGRSKLRAAAQEMVAARNLRLSPEERSAIAQKAGQGRAALPPERRSEIARQAALARWEKVRKAKANKKGD